MANTLQKAILVTGISTTYINGARVKAIEIFRNEFHPCPDVRGVDFITPLMNATGDKISFFIAPAGYNDQRPHLTQFFNDACDLFLEWAKGKGVRCIVVTMNEEGHYFSVNPDAGNSNIDNSDPYGLILDHTILRQQLTSMGLTAEECGRAPVVLVRALLKCAKLEHEADETSKMYSYAVEDIQKKHHIIENLRTELAQAKALQHSVPDKETHERNPVLQQLPTAKLAEVAAYIVINAPGMNRAAQDVMFAVNEKEIICRSYDNLGSLIAYELSLRVTEKTKI